MTLTVLLFAVCAHAALPRQTRVLRSNIVRLSDLFTGLEPGQDCDIGAAPPAGSQLVIEEAQLTAIATQFGVAWRPGELPVEVVLRHASRLVAPAEFMQHLHESLLASGAPSDIDVHLSLNAALTIPAEITSAPEIDQITYEPQSGSFAASIRFASDNGESLWFRISGTALEMVDLPVLKRSMRAGTVLGLDDLQLRRVRRSVVGEQTLLIAQDAVGQALSNEALAGSPLSRDMLRPPTLVSRGALVTLKFEADGLTVTIKGEAMEAGALNDRIHILNPGSHAVLAGQVTGFGSVQLDTAVPPIFLASQMTGLPPLSALNLAGAGPMSNGSSGLP